MRLWHCALLAFSLLYGQVAHGIQEHWTSGFSNKREFVSPSAFEKIYVTREQIVSTPDGIYYIGPCGHYEKVRALLEDCDGQYVLIIQTQCPLCGQCYYEKEPPEGMCCPLFKKETRPFVWSEH